MFFYAPPAKNKVVVVIVAAMFSRKVFAALSPRAAPLGLDPVLLDALPIDMALLTELGLRRPTNTISLSFPHAKSFMSLTLERITALGGGRGDEDKT